MLANQISYGIHACSYYNYDLIHYQKFLFNDEVNYATDYCYNSPVYTYTLDA